MGSVVEVHRLSCSMACEIFPIQSLNPCPLHWQADSYPLCHQGNPTLGCSAHLISGLGWQNKGENNPIKTNLRKETSVTKLLALLLLVGYQKLNCAFFPSTLKLK